MEINESRRRTLLTAQSNTGQREKEGEELRLGDASVILIKSSPQTIATEIILTSKYAEKQKRGGV